MFRCCRVCVSALIVAGRSVFRVFVFALIVAKVARSVLRSRVALAGALYVFLAIPRACVCACAIQYNNKIRSSGIAEDEKQKKVAVRGFFRADRFSLEENGMSGAFENFRKIPAVLLISLFPAFSDCPAFAAFVLFRAVSLIFLFPRCFAICILCKYTIYCV